MTEYLTEQEQIQQLKMWVKQYGMTIVMGITIALLISTGWHFYQDYRTKTLYRASSVYDEMLTLRAQNNSDGALIQAKKLIKNYSRTPYAQMAAFMISRDAVLKKDYPEAITQLNWVINHSNNNSIQEIARIREARILINTKKPDAAITILKKLDDKHFIGMVNEVRGDAYVEMNDYNSARNSYQLALQQIPNAESTRPILEMKYDNLAEESVKG